MPIEWDYLISSIKKKHYHIFAIIFFFTLTIVVTWPLITQINKRVPGWFIADNYEYLWKIWWFKHSIIDLGQNPLIEPDIFYPNGFNLAHGELTPLHTLLGLPTTWIFGEILTYNIFALLSFFLTGIVTYFLVFRWTGNNWAGIFSGVLFVLNPYHTVRYGGILPLMSIEGIPILLLGLDLWIEKIKTRWMFLALSGFLITSWASVYYAFGVLLLFPIYTVFKIFSGNKNFLNKKNWKNIVIFFSGLALIIVPLAIPYLILRQKISLQIPLTDTDYWSASFTDYLIPSGIHPLWGKWVLSNLLSIPKEYPQLALEFVLGISFIGILFFIYGLRESKKDSKKALVWMLAIAFILSLGPRMKIGRHPLVIPAPANVVTAFNSTMDIISNLLPTNEKYIGLATNGLTVPLPALFVRWLITPLQGMRAWNRFALFVSFGVSLISGLGFSKWYTNELSKENKIFKLINEKTFASLIVITFAMFELWPQTTPLQPVQPRKVDIWLSENQGNFNIMEFPLTSSLSAPQMLYTKYHEKRIAFAYGTYYPYWYREKYPELEHCPNVDCIRLLKTWEVEYVLLSIDDKPVGPQLEKKFRDSESLKLVGQFDTEIVYKIIE